MGKYENNICQAVDILVQQAISGLRLDKTILGVIESCVDEGLGEYRVKYQDSGFTAYAQGDIKYRKGTSVYVLIPSNDITQDRIILGSVSKLGEAYISAATAEDKMTKIGSNIFTKSPKLGLCSYKAADAKGYSGTDLYNIFGIDASDFAVYKENAEYLMIAATFQTALEQEQQVGNGDYGLVVTCRYYNDNTKDEYLRKYTINVANMIGQPYQFILPNRQYGLFAIDANGFVNIESVDIYSKGFPVQAENKNDDIFISDFEFYFMQNLTEDEIAGTSLRIVTPEGGYFKSGDTTKTLLAEIKIKGSAISAANNSNIEYYWFIRDAFVDMDSEWYSPYAGIGWRCLNRRLSDSLVLGGTGIDSFIADVYKKTIYAADCPSRENLFKCVAVMEDTVLYGTVTILNQAAAYNISIAASEPNNFPFETAYNFHLIPTVVTNGGTDVSDSVDYYWGYIADNGEFEQINDNERILYHDPNIAINVITYNVTVYDTSSTQMLGSAEITFVNTNDQKVYNLIIANANQVFKYNEEGISPASNSIEKQDRQIILPLTFELYDKQSRIVAEKDAEKIKLFEMRWLWPVENTMLIADSAGANIVNYNGIECWERKIYNDTQLTFIFEIENKYNINNTQNNVILEVKYQDIVSVVATNFTFTKEGELGTNGTKYTARLQPQDALDIEQVYVHNNLIRYWKYEDGTIKHYVHSGRFNIEIWDGGTSYLKSANTAHWEVLPTRKRNSLIDYTNYNVRLDNNTVGRIYSQNNNLVQATILQGYINTNEYSSLAKDYYATYSLPVVKTNDISKTYIVTGGYDHVIYSADGNRSSFDNILPFVLRCFNVNTQEEIALNENDIEWYISWENQYYVGTAELEIEPPEKLMNQLDNYIQITNGNDQIILSIHFYINRYSMSAMNGWDGSGIEVNEDKGYVLTPQIAAGTKNHSTNTFTGIAIGQTFQKDNKLNNEIGLFGYLDGVQTINLDAKTGAAAFGINDGDHGCLHIQPSSSTNSDAVTLTSGNFQRATYKKNIKGKFIDVPGTGVEMEFSTKDPHIYFGNGNFEVDKKGDVFLNGTIQASKGYIGGWTVYNGSLKSDTISINANTSSISATDTTARRDTAILEQLIEDGVDFNSDGSLNTDWTNTKNDLLVKFPSGTNRTYVNIIIDDNQRGTVAQQNACKYIIDTLETSYARWYIKGDGSFKFGTNDTYIRFDQGNNKLQIRADLMGTRWYINEEGTFSLGGGGITYTNGQLRINAGSISLNTVNVTYNGIPLQGRYISPINISIQDAITGNCYGYEYPTMVILSFSISRGNTDVAGATIYIPDIPTCIFDVFAIGITEDKKEDSVQCRLSHNNLSFYGLQKNKIYHGTFIYAKQI